MAETKSVVQHLDGDQRTKSDAEVQAELPDRFDEGKSQKGAHKNDDPKDERSIGACLSHSTLSVQRGADDEHS